MNAAKPAKAATAGLLVGAAPVNASGDVELAVDVSAGYSGWPSVASVMRGALGTVVLVGVVSGVVSTPAMVEVASISGEFVELSVSFSGVVTTTGVGVEGAGVSTSVSVSFSGGGVLMIVVGVSEIAVSISVSFSGLLTIMGVVVVIGNVDIELVVMVKVFVIGTVLGVSLMVTTVLVTR